MSARLGFSAGTRRWLPAGAVWLLAVALWSAHANAASTSDPEVIELHVGFAGKYKLGCWTQVLLFAELPELDPPPELSLVVPDGDGVLSRVACQIVLAEGHRGIVGGYVKFGQAKDELRFELRRDGAWQTIRSFRQGSQELPEPVPPGRELVVLAGPEVKQAEGMGDDKDWQAEVARVGEDSLELPSEWYGYEGVDRLVLLTERPEEYRSLHDEQQAALDQWLRLGGRLILSVGAAGEKVLAEGEPLARFAPGRFEQILPLRQTTALETYAGTRERLDLVSGEPTAKPQGDDGRQPPDERSQKKKTRFELGIPKLVDVRGRIEAYEGNHPRDQPLVIRAPFGLGEVVFVGVDIDRPPVSRWRGRAGLIDRLMNRPEVAEELTDQHVLGRVTELGYTDLVGQLQMALAQFAGVALIPFAAVALLVALYIVCIGPLDYLLLKKIIRRMELTWITFPAIVLAFSLGIFALAHWLKGSRLRINQIDLVDVDAESQTARGTSWSTLYSPRVDTFDLAVRTDPGEIKPAETPRVLLSWMASGSSGLAGAGRAAGAAMFTHPYDFSPQLDAIDRLPLPAWSTRSLLARWWAKASPLLAAKLSDRDHFLSGTLTLPADWPLTDCVLIYDRWAYPLTGTGGEKIDVERDLEAQTVETFFRHITIIEEKSRRAPYDRASVDLARIVETMMFHDLVGGEVYTRLSGQTQSYVDLSGLVGLGRAIIVGRSAQPATTLLRTDGTDADSSAGDSRELVDPDGERLTFYRFVLPVAQAGTN